MRPDTTRQLSGPERLEDRSTMDVTASNILWEPTALSTDNESAVLANATARSFAMDVALPDASRLARGLQNGDVEIYDTSTGARIHTIPSQGRYASQIETSPDGTILAVGTGAPSVRLFDARSYAEIGGFAMPGFVYSIVFRGNEIFASTWEGGPTTVYDVRTRAVRTIGGTSNQLDYLASIDDRLYAYDARGTLKELDPASGQVLRSVNIAGGNRIDASSESGIIAMGTAEGNVVVFDESLNQLGAFHPGMGAIQHVGFDASGTRLTARSDAGGVVFINLSTIRTGGMMTEAGRTPAGDSAAYEVGMPMTPDGTVAFVHEANRVTALKTPWEPLPPPSPEGGSEPGESGVPSEVTDLIGEAVLLARNGTPWRAPEAGEIISSSSAKATRVQLVPHAGEVVAFTANVFPATSVTAHAYKGTEKIWSGAVPSDGVFSYENAEGITEVLFTSNATTYVSNVSIVTDEAVDVPPYALTPMNSAEFATFAARPIAQPTNMSAAAQRLDIRGAMSGTGSSESRVLLNRDQNNYTLLRMNVSSGNSRIFDVKAIRLKGLDYRQREEVEFVGLQDGFVERIDDRTWIVAPGMPATLVATLGFYQKSTYSIQVVNGLSREVIMPLLTMGKNTVDIDLLTMNDQFRTEGVFPGMTDVRQSEWPVFAKAGHHLNATYNIRNEALNGGAIGLDVYVGWHAGEPTRGTLQKTFSFPLGGGETKMVSVNVTAPPKPADATSDRPIIHTVARLPNGESAVHARLGKAQKGEARVITNKEGGGLNISYVSHEYTAREQERIRYLTDKALNALLTSSDDRLVAVRDTLGDDHIVQLLAESSAAALGVAGVKNDAQEAADVAIGLSEDLFAAEVDVMADGIGGSLDEMNLWDPAALAEHLQIYSYNAAKNHLLFRLSQNEISNLEQTALGRFFLGIAQRAVEAKNDEELAGVANIIHNATGIAAKKANIFLNAASSPDRRVDMLKQMFAPSNLQHSDELLRSIFNTQSATPGEVTDTTTTLTESHAVRIRFNFATPDQDFHHGNVYLMSVDGQQLSNDPLLAVNITDQFFVDIPMINIAKAAREIYGLGGLDFLADTHFRFKIALWDEVNSNAGLQGNNITDAIDLPEVISMNRPEYVAVGSYSTLPNTPEFARRKSLEDHALSTIKQNFPLDRTHTWLNTLGSDFHLGEDSAAMDLNMDTGGDNDEDQPIRVVADGTIDSIGLDYGSIRIRHVAQINGEMRYWFTTYLHMRIVANGMTQDGQVLYEAQDKNGNVIATLFKGKSLEALDTIGGVCGRGLINGVRNDHAFKTHLHMEGEDDAGNMIHFGKLLTDMNIKTYALNDEAVPAGMYTDGKIHLAWNDVIDEWVNENYGVIFDQELSSTGHDNVWVAMTDDPNQRKRVVWKSVRYGDEPEEKLRWVSFGNEKEELVIDSNGSWHFITHA